MQLDFRTATRLTALMLLSVGLGACKGTDVATETPAEACTTGHQRACYGGPEETAGVGKCRRGVQECIGGKWSPLCKDEILPVAESCDGTDNDCDGSIDEGKDNGCGGCAQLPGSPGSACTGCGTWTCDGVDRLTCVPPQNTVGDDCQRDGCPGKYVCGAGGVSCDAPAKNACGTCGGPAVGGIGESCTASGGCAGKLECNAAGTATVCRATGNVNACGVCNGPVVTGVGDPCTASDGCTGKLACNAAGDGTVCKGGKNNCGTCGAPDVTGLGDPCAASNGCAGTKVCNAAGTGTSCLASENKNECGLCGGPAVANVNGACVNAQGCVGRLVCNAAGDGTVCDGPASCTPSPANVKLSELSPAGPSASNLSWNTDEFVELYNPSATAQNLSGHALWYRPANSATFIRMITFPAGTVVAAKGFLLLGKSGGANSTGYVGPPAADLLYSAGSDMSSNGGQVWLTATATEPTGLSDPDLVDMVGYGSAAAYEGTAAAPAPGAADTLGAGSIERKAFVGSTTMSMGSGGADAMKGNGYDSNDNGADFVTRALRQPQSSSSPAEQ